MNERAVVCVRELWAKTKREFDASGHPWMCIGGIATIAQGMRRNAASLRDRG